MVTLSRSKNDESIRILHVDDEENQLIMTKIFLQRTNPHYIIDSCNSLNEAFEKLGKEKYDCIISDFKMPEMNGIEFAEKVRITSDIPFILYTGQGSEEVASAAFNMGIDDYLRKEIEPSHYQVLSNRILKAVRQYIAEKGLEESEDRFRGIAERSFEAIIILDKMGKITYASPAIEKFTGNHPEFYIGKQFMDFCNQPSNSDIVEAYNKLQNGEKIENLIIESRKADGTPITLETNASPILQNGEITGYQAVYRDVTDRLKMESQIKENEQRYRTMFESMDDAVAVYEALDNGEDFIIKDFNPAAEHIDNIGKDDIIGRKVTEVFPGVKEFKILKIFQRVWKTGIPEHHPAGLYKDNRIEGWRENYVYKLPSGEIVAIYQDLTDKQQMIMDLERSEQRYRTVVEKSPNPISVTIGSKIVFVNMKRAEIYGTGNPADIIGKDISETVYPEDVDKLRKIIDAVEKDEPINVSENFRLINIQGEVRNYTVYSSPITYVGKKAIIHAFIDITEREIMNEALIKSEAKYKSLVENAPYAISITLGETIIYANKQRTRLFGDSSSKDVVGANILDHIYEDDKKEIIRRREARSRGESIPIEFSFRMYDDQGDLRTVNSYSAPIEYEGKKATQHILQDITEQKRIEEELRRSEILYRTLIENSPFGISITHNSEIIYGNKKRLEILGYDNSYQEEAFNFRVIPEDREALLSRIKARERGDEVEPWYEFRIRTKKGEIKHISSYNTFIEYEGKKATIHILIDITKQKQMEKELSNYMEQIESQIKKNTEDLVSAERMSGAGRIATMLGHDLLGPLQTIKSGVYIMKNIPENAEEALGLIEKAADRAADMLMEFRNSVKDQPINPERVNVNGFIKRILSEILLPGNVVINYKEKDVGDSWFDLSALRRVLENLIRNAYESMPDGGVLTILTSKDDESNIIEIIDTGIGIKDEDIPKLFTAFHTTKEHGLGIGLAYCKRAIENHGGSIKIESEVGVGTRVIVALPREENAPKRQGLSTSDL